MHELSICRALLDQATAIAMKHRARLHTVTIRVGPLAGVEPRLLADAYPLACAGSLAEGSVLAIEHAPVRVHCPRCHTETDANPNHLACARCGEQRTDLRGGDELLLLSVSLETPTDQPCEACDV